MENLFGFEYQTETLAHQDNTPSKWKVVYGQSGQIIGCKKDSYTIVQAGDVSKVGEIFQDKGYQVNPFIKDNGGIIGLNIGFGRKMTVIGETERNYNLFVPNNNTGMGYLKVHEKRLVCTNGMTRDIPVNVNWIKIPHTWDYNASLKLVTQVIESSETIFTMFEERDAALNNAEIDRIEAKIMLNKWFYDVEMPDSHKKDLTFGQFRAAIFNDPDSIKSYDRYSQLMAAYDREMDYNQELGLDLSKYTVLATVNNYLSRRIEKSNSKAPVEVQFERTAAKIASLV